MSRRRVRGSPRSLAPGLLLALACSPEVLAEGFDGWSVSVGVEAPAARIAAVRLPDEVLGACAGPALPDLRLAGPGGAETPFAIVRDAERRVEREIAASIESYTQEGQASIALITLPEGNLPVTRLLLGLARDPLRTFHRTCQVWGRGSLTRTVEVRFETSEVAGERTVATPWILLGSGLLSRDAAGIEALSIAVDAPYRYLRIVIQNGDSPPLPLGSVTAFAGEVYAVFEPAGETRFTLHAGNAEAPAPRYEAQLTLAGVVAGDLPRASLGPLARRGGAPGRGPAPGQTAVAWVMAAAVALSLLLLAWTAARVRAEEAGAGRR